MKKVIGVMPLWDEEKDSIWMLPGYLGGIYQSGAIPFIFPLTISKKDALQLAKSCDGFLFTGGQDVSPELYKETRKEKLGETCEIRDELEKNVFRYALKENKAVFGICRGIQFINVILGGTLYQDIPSEYKTTINHSMMSPYDRICHWVDLVKDSPLEKLLQKETIGVNSSHHQAIKALAPELKSMAISEDGLIESVYMPDKKFVWAVQWHPEFSFKVDENSQKLFQAFINHC